VPTYQYRCTDCGEQLEVVQKFTDEPLTTCPACQGQLRKVFSAVGVVFKGSGFYRNDSRSDGETAAADKPKETAGAGKESSSGSSGSGSSSSGSSSSSSGTSSSGGSGSSSGGSGSSAGGSGSSAGKAGTSAA
jgi:putative FmdB family regulatory protein